MSNTTHAARTSTVALASVKRAAARCRIAMDMVMDEGRLPGGGAAVAEDAMSRFSLDVSAGCGGRHSTLLDEYERLAFEAQLNRAILRRCYSEPSPVRLSEEHQRPPAGGGGGGDARAPPWPRGSAHDQGEAARRDGGGGGGGSFWRLHEVLARWLEALTPVFCWLRSAWECRRVKQPADDAARRPPPTVPRVRLMDYLR